MFLRQRKHLLFRRCCKGILFMFLFSGSKITDKAHFLANRVTWCVLFFLPCFCHSSFAPEILFPFLSSQQNSVIYYFASCRLLILLCRIDYSCWLNYSFLWEQEKKVYEKKVFTKLIFQVLSGLRFRQDLAGNSRLFLLSFISSECTASSVRTAFHPLVVAEVTCSFL